MLRLSRTRRLRSVDVRDPPCLAKHVDEAGPGLAVLFTVPGERHSVGLSLAQLVVADAGWNIPWLSEGPPKDELALLVEDRRPNLLVTSCSGNSPRAAVEPYEDALLEQRAFKWKHTRHV